MLKPIQVESYWYMLDTPRIEGSSSLHLIHLPATKGEKIKTFLNWIMLFCMVFGALGVSPLACDVVVTAQTEEPPLVGTIVFKQKK